MGYDAVVGLAIVALGVGLGYSGAVMNHLPLEWHRASPDYSSYPVLDTVLSATLP